MRIETMLRFGVYGLTLFAVSHGAAESPQTHNECHFPDTQSVAPPWVCQPQHEDYALMAVGSKSRMPSVSLQNRKAGLEAMKAVARRIDAAAAEELSGLAGRLLDLKETAYSSELDHLRAVGGVKVVERALSPRRDLYVLAGVERAQLTPVMKKTLEQLLLRNGHALSGLLSPDEMMALRDAISHYEYQSQRQQ